MHSAEKQGEVSTGVWEWDSICKENAMSEYAVACAASELNPGIVYQGLVRMRRRLSMLGHH